MESADVSSISKAINNWLIDNYDCVKFDCGERPSKNYERRELAYCCNIEVQNQYQVANAIKEYVDKIIADIQIKLRNCGVCVGERLIVSEFAFGMHDPAQLKNKIFKFYIWLEIYKTGHLV